MTRRARISGYLIAAAALVAGVGAGTGARSAVTDGIDARAQGGGDAERAPAQAQQMRLELVISERRLYEYVGDELVGTYPVSVGKPGHETPTGDFIIHRIDWNPDWTPPDSPWAAGREYKPPGHPDNPMGRVRMVYMAPYTIHGTEDLASLGRAESHGSVRMANDDIIDLARRVMEHGGASRPDAWFDEVLGTPTQMRQVDLPDPVPLSNVP